MDSPLYLTLRRTSLGSKVKRDCKVGAFAAILRVVGNRLIFVGVRLGTMNRRCLSRIGDNGPIFELKRVQRVSIV